MATAAVDEIAGNCLAVRVRLLGRAVTSLYDHALEEHGVSIAQINLLAALGKIGPCSPARIGEVLQLERSTVSRNLSLFFHNCQNSRVYFYIKIIFHIFYKLVNILYILND